MAPVVATVTAVLPLSWEPMATDTTLAQVRSLTNKAKRRPRSHRPPLVWLHYGQVKQEESTNNSTERAHAPAAPQPTVVPPPSSL